MGRESKGREGEGGAEWRVGGGRERWKWTGDAKSQGWGFIIGVWLEESLREGFQII